MAASNVMPMLAFGTFIAAWALLCAFGRLDRVSSGDDGGVWSDGGPCDAGDGGDGGCD